MSTTGVDAYNLGTGMGYSVLEMVEAFEKVSGKKVPYKITERRPGDVAVCFADASKAKRELGWEATRGLEEMCRFGNGNQIIKWLFRSLMMNKNDLCLKARGHFLYSFLLSLLPNLEKNVPCFIGIFDWQHV